MSRWHAIKPMQWSFLRHQIESFGLQAVEDQSLGKKTLKYDGQPHSNTIIRAYMLWQPMRKYATMPQALLDLMAKPNLDTELMSDAYPMPNSFILLVRGPMPIGGKAFVPLHEQSKYAILQNQKGHEHELGLMKEKQAMRFHACDRPLMVSETSALMPHYFEYLKPPDDYVCSGCNKLGHHYREACFIWPKVYSSGELLFGSKKFGTAVDLTEEDAKQFAIRHKLKM